MQNNLMYYAKFTALIGNGIFAIFGLLLLIAGIVDMISTRKLTKELNITLEELNYYCNIYLN